MTFARRGVIPPSWGTRLVWVLALAFVSPLFFCAAAQAEQPHREGLYLGLDPTIRLATTPDNKLPSLIGVNFRPGWCITPWYHLGMDITLNFVMDNGGSGLEDAPKLLQVMNTFFPVAGLFVKGGVGWDPYDTHRWVISGSTGYEFGVSSNGGVGLGLAFTELIHSDGRSGWRMYGFFITFSGYRLERGLPLDDDF